ncbi:GerAB/ArcD/ProY family transporter [Oceanobacillus halophilus]|uniref:Spore gernimation protein n=1 Tax=Oceanobacillus halophilus TaxID=930130 RepID=A0A495A5V4_9BACI|nr:endospore germination permease [Oceanobacillus halophilus]RKQ34584.1 spore gernimation protein [Oceanobacillus halophilus]
MSTFKYADDKIKTRDIMIAVPSMVIAVGILAFPRLLSEVTFSSDGWVAILLSGLVAVIFTWAVAKIAANFPNQSFFTYASFLVSKPIAVILVVLFSIQGITLTAFEVRAITDISHQYLFQETPMQIISLTFLLVVVYAVSGSRAGIFRLNVLFMPIIFVTTVILVLFSIGYMEVKNILPVLKTDVDGYMQGTLQSALSYTGIGVLFFYISLVRNPKKAPRMAAFGMSGAVVIYMLIYLTCIAVFGQSATEVIRFPFVELAKTVEIPGGFFERLESIFFVIWIMAIFTTTVMAFDATIFALNSIFPKVKKIKLVFTLTPFIYLIALFPNNYLETDTFGDFVSYYGWGLSITVLILLWIMYKVKGAKKSGKK